MKYLSISTACAFLVLVLMPTPALAATMLTARTLVVSESPVGNAYLMGTDVNVAAALPADLEAAGGTLTVSAPVSGDAFLAGATIDIRKNVAGDVRAIGGKITIDAPVTGDLVLVGGSINASTTATDTRIAGGSVRLSGSNGPVTIYAADVLLSGQFKGDVTIVASDKITLAPGTHIAGSLKYNAPQEAEIPASSTVDGGVTYTGASTYLPTNEEARTFAIAGAGVFFIVHVLALLIVVGLLAGLFPVFAEQVADRVLARPLRRSILLALLGFGIVVAMPVFILILIVSFVGIGLAIILGLSYLLLLTLGYLYAGVLAGAALSRGLFKRPHSSWKYAMLGMLILYLIEVIPRIGMLVTMVLTAVAIGSIVSIGFSFAFGRNRDGIEDTEEELSL